MRTMFRTASAGAAVLLAATVLLSGCSAGTSTTTGTRAQPPKEKMQSSVGTGEGQLNLIAWAGYAEDGSNDKTVDWVHPFEAQTGCQVHTTYGATSDDMVQLMRTGQYDGVSASGDATLRLIYAGDVAPVDTKLVPNYDTISPFLKDGNWNSVNGQMYGIPHGWGANLLMYTPSTVTPAPTSWSAVFERLEQVQGQGHRLRLPHLHRGRGALPEGDEAVPGDHRPVLAHDQAARRRRRGAQEPEPEHR